MTENKQLDLNNTFDKDPVKSQQSCESDDSVLMEIQIIES